LPEARSFENVERSSRVYFETEARLLDRGGYRYESRFVKNSVDVLRSPHNCFGLPDISVEDLEVRRAQHSREVFSLPCTKVVQHSNRVLPSEKLFNDM
jgi:hypothetical protein